MKITVSLFEMRKNKKGLEDFWRKMVENLEKLRREVIRTVKEDKIADRE